MKMLWYRLLCVVIIVTLAAPTISSSIIRLSSGTSATPIEVTIPSTRSSQPGLNFENPSHLTPNGTYYVNQFVPVSLPLNKSRPYVPFNVLRRANVSSSDPEDPCTTQQSWNTYSCGSNGVYYQSGTMVNSIVNSNYNYNNIVAYQTQVSFGWTNPSSALKSGNWISAGFSVTSATSAQSIDLAYSYYVYVNNAGAVGVAWYIIAGCEWPPACGNGNDYLNLDSNYATISGAHASDAITLLLYWNSQYNYFVLDYRDPSAPSSCPSCMWTVEDFVPPSYAFHTFYFGIQHLPSAGYNPPYDYAYASQLGVTSNQNPLYYGPWEVTFTDYKYQISGDNFQLGPTSIITAGATAEPSDLCCQTTMGDAWWHYNWAWGGLGANLDHMTIVPNTPIDSFGSSSSQVNGQIFAAGSSYRNVCVQVTNFATLKSDADSGGEGGWLLGNWISIHPWADNVLWNVLSSCINYGEPITWQYDGGYTVADNSSIYLA